MSTTIKGARISNEDTCFSDGRFFSLFDGHGGKHAARVCHDHLPEHFYHLLESGRFSGPAPKPVQVCAMCNSILEKAQTRAWPFRRGTFSLLKKCSDSVCVCVCVCVCLCVNVCVRVIDIESSETQEAT